jgi:hypothetical protein
MPAPLRFADANAWTIGWIRRLDARREHEAVSPDWWGNAGFAETGLTEDRYVSAVEIREVNNTQNKPGASSTTVGGLFIFHHAIMTVEAAGAAGGR